MRILLIHGRGQQGLDQAVLAEKWTRALRLAFERAGMVFPSEIKIDFPYYGNELVNLLALYRQGMNSGEVIMRGEATEDELNFETQLLNELAENAGLDKQQALLEFGPEHLELGLLNHALPMYLIRGLDKLSRRAGNASIRFFTEDVTAYLIVPLIRKRINEMAGASLNSEPTVVISHSLGTVLAYDILRELDRKDYDIQGLITLGSPLGVRALQRQLAYPLVFPSCIKGEWLNIYDPLDIVSLNPLNKEHFGVEPPVTNLKVVNASDNRHDISEYLHNPEIAHALTRFFS